MSDSIFPPFLKWGKSKDPKKPDKFKIRVKSTQTFETEYTINIDAEIYDDGEWTDMVVPLKGHESPNSSLLDQFIKAVKDGKIKNGSIIIITTYLDKSKNNRPIRRYSLAKS